MNEPRFQDTSCRDRAPAFVVGAQLDLEHRVAHVTVHAGMTDAARLRKQIEGCNFRNPVPLRKAEVSSHQAMHHAAATAAHGGHEAMGHDMSDELLPLSKRRTRVVVTHARIVDGETARYDGGWREGLTQLAALLEATPRDPKGDTTSRR